MPPGIFCSGVSICGRLYFRRLYSATYFPNVGYSDAPFASEEDHCAHPHRLVNPGPEAELRQQHEPNPPYVPE